jgi:hypothetical protein
MKGGEQSFDQAGKRGKRGGGGAPSPQATHAAYLELVGYLTVL